MREKNYISVMGSRVLPFMTAPALCIAVIVCIGLSWAAVDNKKEEKPEKKTELYQLSNEELLNQAQTLFNQASDNFRGQMREMAKAEKLLIQAQEATAALTIPPREAPKPYKGMDPVEAAKTSADYAKTRLDAVSRRLELIQAEKDLSDRHITVAESAKSAAASFVDAMNRLDLFLFEIGLRIKDRSLTSDKVPDLLSAGNLTQQKQIIAVQQNALKQKSDAAQEKLKALVSVLEEAKKAVTEAKAYHASGEEKYAQEMKRQSLEKEYSGQSPERLISRLSDLQEERVWLNSAFNQASVRFGTVQKKSLQIQTELDGLPKPEAADVLRTDAAVRTEEMEEAAKQVDTVADYHSKRIEKIGELRSSLELLIKQGETFQGDAAVLRDHISRMQVPAKLLKELAEQGKIKSDQIPEDSRLESLSASGDEISKTLSDVLSAVQKSREQIEQTAKDIEKSETVRKEAKERSDQLKKAYQAAQKARQWDEELKNLTAEQILQKFQESGENLKTASASLEKNRETHKKALADLNEIRLKLDSLKDPLLRSAQEESLEEKQNIVKKLYQFAGMELPVEPEKPEEAGKPPESGKPAGKPAAKASDAKPADTAETEQYQNLLSTRTRVISEQQTARAEMLNALMALNSQIEKYSAALSDTAKLAMQYNANAVEIKKRLGRRQLESKDIPDNISEALKRELITQLETELAGVMTQQTQIRQETETLSKPDTTLRKRQELLTQTLESVGKRVDIFREMEKLAADFERTRDKLSKIEQQSLEQMGIRLMETDDTAKEYLLSFVPSERAQNLTEMLKSYYQEVIELGNRRENLIQQKEKTENLIQLAEQEKTAVTDLLPLLLEEIKTLEAQKEEEWVKIQARLMPQKAQEILANFETKTQKRLPMPTPIPDDKKTEEIAKAADILFERHIALVASDKWVRLFEQRLSASGLGSEIGRYQDKMGSIKAADLALQRRIQYINGISQDEPPRAKAETRNFANSEIGMLRSDRYHTRSQKAVEVLIKLAAVLLATLLLHGIVRFLMNRTVKRAKKKAEESGKISSVIAVFPLLKTLFVFIIWGVAILASLSILGFNVGAILAGLGIGGLAIAMASKETLSDIIGGISIFLSGSFKIGDTIMFKGQDAEVEEIGVRYTRLRASASKFQISVPNSQLAQAEVVNISRAAGFTVNADIPLSIRNSAEQIEQAMKLISELIESNPNTQLRRVRFSGVANYSFMISLRYIINDFSLRHPIRTEVNTEIVRHFQQNHIEFAAAPYFRLDPCIPESQPQISEIAHKAEPV